MTDLFNAVRHSAGDRRRRFRRGLRELLRDADRHGRHELPFLSSPFTTDVRARSWPQPPSTSWPAEWRSLASTPRAVQVARHLGGALPRSGAGSGAVDRVVRDEVHHGVLAARAARRCASISSSPSLTPSSSVHWYWIGYCVARAYASPSCDELRRSRCAARAAAAARAASALRRVQRQRERGLDRVRAAGARTRADRRRSRTRGSCAPMSPSVPSSVDRVEHVVEVVRRLAHAHEHDAASPARRVRASATCATISALLELAQRARRGPSCRTRSRPRSRPASRRTGRRAAAARSRWSGRPPSASRSRAEPSAPGCSERTRRGSRSSPRSRAARRATRSGSCESSRARTHRAQPPHPRAQHQRLVARPRARGSQRFAQLVK